MGFTDYGATTSILLYTAKYNIADHLRVKVATVWRSINSGLDRLSFSIFPARTQL
jgi:hypothetical protein